MANDDEEDGDGEIMEANQQLAVSRVVWWMNSKSSAVVCMKLSMNCEETKHNHAHFFGRIIETSQSPMAMDDDDDNDHTYHPSRIEEYNCKKKTN